MMIDFPIWLLSLDYIFGIVMWILITKFILNLFLNENSNFIIFRCFTNMTNPIINLTLIITPKFIVQPLIPLYIAWIIFMLRVYVLPLLLGYTYLGTFSFMLEKNIILFINTTLLKIALYLNYGI